jgi:hypothetical protein
MVDSLKVISGQGMPSYRHHELGDLYVQIKVNFPTSIDPAVIPLLEQALPTRNAMPKLSKKAHIDEVTLEEPNDRQRKSAANNGDEMDEDDDERPGVACAQRMSLLSRSEPRPITDVLQSKIGLYKRSVDVEFSLEYDVVVHIPHRFRFLVQHESSGVRSHQSASRDTVVQHPEIRLDRSTGETRRMINKCISSTFLSSFVSLVPRGVAVVLTIAHLYLYPVRTI